MAVSAGHLDLLRVFGLDPFLLAGRFHPLLFFLEGTEKARGWEGVVYFTEDWFKPETILGKN